METNDLTPEQNAQCDKAHDMLKACILATSTATCNEAVAVAMTELMVCMIAHHQDWHDILALFIDKVQEHARELHHSTTVEGAARHVH